MNVKDVIANIETLAPLSGAAPWDRSGIQIASGRAEVAKIGVTIDPMPGYVEAAVAWGADLILTHHPLYFDPKPLDSPNLFLDTVRTVIKADAWLYAAHTSMDALSHGAAGWLADALGFTGRTVLEQTDPDNPKAGLGIIGDLPEPLAFDDFAAALKSAVDRDFWTVTGEMPTTVSRAAYCTGSGGSLIAKAKEAGADVYVTGDVKYHQALEAGMPVIDVGHFSLEERMLRVFAEQLQAELAPKGIEFKFFKAQDPLRVFNTHEAGDA
jgi:dinuclear metal center YbgI/SA1388 family protein